MANGVIIVIAEKKCIIKTFLFGAGRPCTSLIRHCNSLSHKYIHTRNLCIWLIARYAGGSHHLSVRTGIIWHFYFACCKNRYIVRFLYVVLYNESIIVM